ncbi:Nucleus export protein [Yarrowia sp. C11]|nr:Nucleus export protein [Yarrowia sp. C11]KAG5370970.1 Nucleus export protein [Yarrowia sp. E02]
MSSLDNYLNLDSDESHDSPLADRHPLSEQNNSFLNRQSTPKTKPANLSFINKAPIAYVSQSEVDRIYQTGNQVYEEGRNDFPSFNTDHIFSAVGDQRVVIDPNVTGSDTSLSASEQLDRYPYIQDESNIQSLGAQCGGLPPSSPSTGNSSSDSCTDILTSPSVQLNQSRIEQRQRLYSNNHQNPSNQQQQQPYGPQPPKKGLFKTATETTRKLFPDMRRNVVNNEASKRSEPSMAMVPSPQKPPSQQYHINPNIPKVDMSFMKSRRRPTSVEFSPIKQYHEIPGRRGEERGHNGGFQPRGSHYSSQFDVSYDDSFEQRYEMYNGRGRNDENRGNHRGNGVRGDGFGGNNRGNDRNRGGNFFGGGDRNNGTRGHSNNHGGRDHHSEDEWEDEYVDYNIDTPNHNINTPCRTPKPKARDHRNSSRESRDDHGHTSSSSSSASSEAAAALNLPILLSIWLQLAYNAIIMAVVSYFVWTFYSTVKRDVDMKVDEYSADILQEMAMCSKDYIANNCMPGKRVPALETMCNAWERCMNRDPKIVGRARVSAETFAEIINGFLRPISFKSMVFVLFLLGGSLFVCNFGFGTYRGPLYQQVKETEKKQEKGDEKEKEKEKEREKRKSRDRGEYERVYDSPSFYVSPRYYRQRGYRRRY